MAIDPLRAPRRPPRVAPNPSPERGSSAWPWLVATLVVVGALAVAGSARRSRAPEQQIKVAKPVAAPPRAPVAAPDSKALATEEIAAIALPSVVGIRCGGQSGAG